MSPPKDIHHRGVLKAAGVVHVGPIVRQVGWYLRDAESYARTAESEVVRHTREMRLAVEQADECHRRSLVSAAIAMLTWGLG